jgi:hypothetical protein
VGVIAVSRALVAIGISKAPPLDELTGAVTDAKYIADYARDYGYKHVKVFTDERRPVRAHSIFKHCKRLFALPDLEQLVIFFQGMAIRPFPHTNAGSFQNGIRTQMRRSMPARAFKRHKSSRGRESLSSLMPVALPGTQPTL